jgi:hypothetical protein
MTTEVLDDLPVELDAAALARKVRLPPGGDDEESFRQLVERARRVARPKVLFKEAYVEERGEETVRIDGIVFTSRMLRLNLAATERVFPFVATCGHELDEAGPSAGEMLESFWWDAIKEAVLACARRRFENLLRHRFRLARTSGMAPGSGDAGVWPIEQQQQLFALLGDVRGRIGVTLTSSCLMIPNKSVSGIRFASERDFRTCQVCRRESCPGRQAPFDRGLWEEMRQNR